MIPDRKTEQIKKSVYNDEIKSHGCSWLFFTVRAKTVSVKYVLNFLTIDCRKTDIPVK